MRSHRFIRYDRSVHAGVGVGDAAGGDAADDDLVGEQPPAALHGGPALARAEQAVDGDDVGVPDEVNARQGHQKAVEDGLD